MPRMSDFDKDALARMLASQHDVIGRRQAIACGLTAKAIEHRLRLDGPWQVILPGVYVAGRGPLTDKQRAMAAWEHAGRAIAITGPAAVTWHGLPVQRSAFVDVLVPPDCRRTNAGFVRLQRTSLLPQVFHTDGKVSYADPARAVTDSVRAMADLSDVRALVAAGVQRSMVAVWQLARCQSPTARTVASAYWS
jgi:hypothetical protein